MQLFVSARGPSSQLQTRVDVLTWLLMLKRFDFAETSPLGDCTAQYILGLVLTTLVILIVLAYASFTYSSGPLHERGAGAKHQPRGGEPAVTASPAG